MSTDLDALIAFSFVVLLVCCRNVSRHISYLPRLSNTTTNQSRLDKAKAIKHTRGAERVECCCARTGVTTSLTRESNVTGVSTAERLVDRQPPISFAVL